MLSLLKDLPANVIGVKSTGQVSREDYKRILLPAMEHLYTRQGKVSLLLQIETSLHDYTLGAWLEDAKLGLKYFSKWDRVAIVSKYKGVVRFTNTFGILVPGQYKGFLSNELLAAKIWVSAH